MTVHKGTTHCFVSILLAGALLFLLAILTSAQLPTGTILGVVKDSSGAVAPNATVTIQSNETNQIRIVTTDSNGAYRVAALPVGHYDIKVEHPGFRTETQTGLNLEVGEEAVVDITLQVGAAEQTVRVTGEAQQVNTTNSTLGSVVGEQTISDLPLNGRNYVDLTLLQPGITQHKNVVNTSGNNPGTLFSSNGAPIQSNSVSLDGASLVNFYAVSGASGTGNTLGVDGIREYKVVTSNFSAEYGMTMGSQTLLVSKGGTNSFHGDAFEFLRNQVLDAANYFDAPTQANGFRRTPPFKRNNFGGALGGPVRKDKTFLFGAYEGLRESIGQTIVSTTVPATCFVATANPCATSAPVGVVNPVAFQLLQLFPKPNLPNNQFTYPFNEPINENWGQGRLDHTFSARDTVFARYTFDDSYFIAGLSYPPFSQNQATRGQFITFSENHIFSPALLNTARFSFSRTSSRSNSPSNFGPTYLNLIPGQQLPGLGTFQISGLTVSTQGGGFGPGSLQNPQQNIFTWSDDVFYVNGKHSWKFGTLINHYQVDLWGPGSRGTFAAANLAGFLQGTLTSVLATFVTDPSYARKHYRYDTVGFYAQDDYRVSPNLTLNLGLRYEFATLISDRNGLNASATPTCVFPCYQVGANYTDRSALHNFSPRIGFAWDVFGDGKTSVRGGAALLYDIATLGAALQAHQGSQAPFATRINLGTTTLTNPISLAGAINSAESQPTQGIVFNQKQPKLYEYNLTVEQQLPWTTVLQVSYVGSRGIHLIEMEDANPTQFQIQNGQPFWAANAPRVVNPTFGAFYGDGADGITSYNGLEVSVTKRVSRGLQFQSEYTYLKLIDANAVENAAQTTSTFAGPVTLLDTRLDRGLSPFDIKNNYRLNVIYNLPTVASSNGLVKGVLNGWWSAVIFSAESGYPFTPSLSTNRSRSRTGSSNPANLDRPDWAPGRNPYNATHGGSSGCTVGSGATTKVIAAGTPLGAPSLYFDPCAFVLEPVGYEGNVGRNSIIGPGLLDLDYSLVKDTSVKWLGEAGKVEFRAEFFNIMNHPNFAQPVRTVFAGTLTDGPNCLISGCAAGTEPPGATTGLIQSTATGTTATQASGNSRQIQFGLKVVF